MTTRMGLQRHTAMQCLHATCTGLSDSDRPLPAGFARRQFGDGARARLCGRRRALSPEVRDHEAAQRGALLRAARRGAAARLRAGAALRVLLEARAAGSPARSSVLMLSGSARVLVLQRRETGQGSVGLLSRGRL